MKGSVKLLAASALVVSLSVASHAQNLVGHWEFEEGSGSTTADLSGSGNNGDIFNADIGGLGDGAETFWFVDPDRGNVGSFFGDATSAYVLAANDIPVMTLEQSFTWAFWANDMSDGAPNNIIFGNRKDVNAVDFVPRQFIKFTPTKFEWHMEGNGNDNLEYGPEADTAENDIPDGVWIHHAVVKNGPTVTYYRDGVAMNSADITQPLSFPQPLFIGGDNEESDGENWEGLIDDVRIYDGAISDAAVAALAGGGTSINHFEIYE